MHEYESRDVAQRETNRPAVRAGDRAGPHGLLALQVTAGNQAVGRLMTVQRADTQPVGPEPARGPDALAWALPQLDDEPITGIRHVIDAFELLLADVNAGRLAAGAATALLLQHQGAVQGRLIHYLTPRPGELGIRDLALPSDAERDYLWMQQIRLLAVEQALVRLTASGAAAQAAALGLARRRH
ncbi:hypothetical protein [Cellulomonas cellasea]|uniref:Uncharacterized protein n=2 Tax=Cellulomonas cellasea TaxID=43670 RepID=A0A0A0BAB2_9CELL|nr:hypothetical protein [Cellulomonas cellasea]KGM02784.1 hypothetical protein Q760_11240 [Cellulomonas cellasea DSM 20118]GEA87640.1 hypothetical protein CCE01nite_15890 [Cellulomonas cellasea]